MLKIDYQRKSGKKNAFRPKLKRQGNKLLKFIYYKKTIGKL